MVTTSHPELTVYDGGYSNIRREVKGILAVKDV